MVRLLVASTLLLASSAALAQSGPTAGSFLGSFQVTKVGGAIDDGAAVGENLCYRCKQGRRPMVFLFVKQPNALTTTLIQNLDKVSGQVPNLAVIICFLGENKAQVTAAADAYAKQQSLKFAAVVVPDEHKNGPADYNLKPTADLTVVFGNRSKVFSAHTATGNEINDQLIGKIVGDLGAMLD